MPHDQTTKRPRRTRDHHNPVTEPRHTRTPQPHQPRNPHHPLTHHHLRHREKHVLRPIQQMNPPRMLRLNRPHQPPQRRTIRISDHLTHRTERPHHKPRPHPPRIRQPPPQQTQQSHHTIPRRTPHRRIHHQHLHRRHRQRITQRDHGGGPGLRGQVLRGPLHGEQGACRFGVPGGGVVLGHGAEGEGFDGGHRLADGVDRVDPYGLAGGPEPGPQHSGAVGVHGDAGEGEGEPGGVVAVLADTDAVQDGVEQGGVEGEPVGFGGQFRFDVQVVALPPGLAQALEDRSVRVAGVGQAVVQVVDGQAGGAGRGPGEGLAGRLGGAQEAGGVGGPVLGVLRSRVDGDGPACGVVGGADDGLYGDGVRGAERERPAQDQFLDGRGAGRGARGEGEVEQCGARQQDGAQDGVVGQPGLGAQGDAAGEHGAVAVGQGDGGAEEGVLGRAQAEARGVGGGAGAGLGPVTLSLEGVRRQVGQRGAGAVEDTRPVDVGAPGEHRRHAGEQCADLVPVPAQGRDGECVGLVGGDQGGQYAVRSGLQEAGDALGGQFGERVGEPDGAADLFDPVVGIGPARHRTGLDRGDHPQPGLGIRQPPHDLGELGQHRLHQPGVESMTGTQPRRLPAPLTRQRRRLLDLRPRTRDDHRLRPVHRRDVQTRERLPHRPLRRTHRQHRTTRRQGIHQPPTRSHQHRRIGQAQHPGRVRGGDLTHRVTGHEVGGHAPVPQQGEQGRLDGEQRGLGVGGPLEGVGVGEDDQAQGLLEVRVEVGAGLVEGGGEDREGGVELFAHREALGALAGEEEGEPAVGGLPADHGVAALERAEQLGAVGRQVDRPVGERGAAGGGAGEVGEAGVGVAVEPVAEAFGLGVQGGLGGGGDDERQDRRRCRASARPLVLGRRRRLFQDDVGVGAADPERGHTCPAGPGSGGPGAGGGEEFDGAGVPVDLRGGLVDVQGAGQQPVPHRLDDLDDAGGAGGGLRVADVGLDRPEPQGLGGAVLTVGGQQGLCFDRVAEGGARTVCLDRVDVLGGEAGVGEGGADHPLLGGTVGRGEAVGGAVLVDRAAPYDGQCLAAGRSCRGEPFDQQHADAFGPAGAVGRRREGLAAAVGGQAALPGELGERARRRHDRDAADQCHAALALAQCLCGEVQGDQRRRAGRVDGDGGAFQAEGVGDAAGGDAAGAADAEVTAQVLGAVLQQGDVSLVGGADEHADLPAAQRQRVESGPFQRLPRGLQQQPLLRVHGEGLAGADPEQARVEVAGVPHESAVDGVRGAGPVGVRVGVVERVDVPAPVGGERADRVGLAADQVPQFVGGADAAGEAAGHRGEHDRVVVGGGGAHRDGRRRGIGAEDLVMEVGGEEQRRGVVEGEGRGEPEPGLGGQRVAQFDGGERVEAEFAERPSGGDRLGGRVAEDACGVAPDQVDERALTLRGRQGGQSATPAGGVHRCGGGRACRLGEVFQQRAAAGGGERLHERRPVDVGDREQRRGSSGGTAQDVDREDGGHRVQTASAQCGAGVALGGHARLGPRSPRQRRTGQAPGAAPLREGVESGVGGGVGTAPAAAPGGGDRGEQDEGVQFGVAEEFVQVPGAGGLAGEYGGEGRGVELGQGSAVRDAGGVHDRGERRLRVVGGPVEEVRHRVAVGQVGGDDRDARSRGADLVGQFLGAGCVRATPAGQYEVSGALGGGPAGDPGTERTGSAGDQDGAARLPAVVGSTRRRYVCQSAGVQAGGAERDLVLGVEATGENGGEPVRRARVEGFGKVQQTARAVRVLESDDPSQAPCLGVGHAGDVVAGAGGDRSPGEEPEGCGDGGVLGGLGEDERRGERRRDVGSSGCLVVRRQDRDDGGYVVLFAEVVREGGPVGSGDGDDVGAGAGEDSADVVCAGCDQNPGAGERPDGGGGQPRPGLLVAPGIGRRGGDRAGRRAEPVPLVGEGIRGQVDGTRARALEHRPPVHMLPVHEQLTQRRQQRQGLTTAPAQRRHSRNIHLGQQPGKHTIRTQLQHTIRIPSGHGISEPDRLTHLPHPVLRIRPLTGSDQGTRHRRHRLDHRLAETQPTHHPSELLEHRLHQPRMKRMTRPQPRRLPTPPGHPPDIRRQTRHHHRRRPIHRRDIKPRKRLPHLRLRRPHRPHHTTGRKPLHQPTPSSHQSSSISQTQHTRRIRGRDLPHRMTRHHIRLQPPRTHQSQQRHLKRKDRRLRPTRLLQPRRIETTQRKTQRPTHLVISRREHREHLIQLPAHTHPLRPLPGEHHPQPALSSNTPHHHITEHHRTPLQHRTRRQRHTHIQRGRIHPPHPLDQRLQRTLGPRRHHPRHHRQHHHRLHRLHRHHRNRNRRLLHDHMRIRPTDPERRHTRTPHPATNTGTPLPRLRQQLHRTRRPLHPRRRHIHMQRPRQHPTPQRLHHLDHTSHTRSRLGMPEVGLHRTQPQRGIGGTVLPVGGQQRLRLDGVTQPGPGAVRLHRVHIRRGQTGRREGCPDHPLLRRPVGRGQAAGGPVLVDRAAPHHRQHLVPVPLGVGEAFHQQQADALAPSRAVRTLREGLAPAVGGQTALSAELDERGRRGHDRHTTGQRQVALTVAQRLRGEVQGDE